MNKSVTQGAENRSAEKGDNGAGELNLINLTYIVLFDRVVWERGLAVLERHLRGDDTRPAAYTARQAFVHVVKPAAGENPTTQHLLLLKRWASVQARGVNP